MPTLNGMYIGNTQYDFPSGLEEVKASNVDSESATSGQVLTADGSGGASWQSAGGGVTSFGGQTGAITLGTGLTMSGNQVSASGGTTLSFFSTSKPSFSTLCNIVKNAKGNIEGVIGIDANYSGMMFPVSCLNRYSTDSRYSNYMLFNGAIKHIDMVSVSFATYNVSSITNASYMAISSTDGSVTTGTPTYSQDDTRVFYWNDSPIS